MNKYRIVTSDEDYGRVASPNEFEAQTTAEALNRLAVFRETHLGASTLQEWRPLHTGAAEGQWYTVDKR